MLPLLGGLGIGAGAGAGATSFSWKDIQKLPLPDVTNRWALLGIVALIGAIVGVAHVYYRNNWTLPWPTTRMENGTKVFSLGFLRNMLVASGVAMATTWIAFANVAVDPPDPNGEVRTNAPEPRSTLLTWNVLVSAVVAGVMGSRMASGQVEMKDLWKTLGKVAEAPARPGIKEKIDSAKTATDAAKIAKQGLPPQPHEIEGELNQLVMPAVLAEARAKVGQPGPEGAGLTLASLEVFQHLKPSVQTLLKNFEIAKVAEMSVDSFIQEADNRGIEASNFKDLLTSLHAQSVRVMELLRALSPT
ncbi:MAG TPA: hypothetical protein VHR66_24750 [Gemmataceae bacterium]|nr:hypothetical protein [Gemmataceae bacterium]